METHQFAFEFGVFGRKDAPAIGPISDWRIIAGRAFRIVRTTADGDHRLGNRRGAQAAPGYFFWSTAIAAYRHPAKSFHERVAFV